MEMVAGQSMVLSLMACALISSLVSRLISAPLYGALMRLQLARAVGLAHEDEAKKGSPSPGSQQVASVRPGQAAAGE